MDRIASPMINTGESARSEACRRAYALRRRRVRSTRAAISNGEPESALSGISARTGARKQTGRLQWRRPAGKTLNRRVATYRVSFLGNEVVERLGVLEQLSARVLAQRSVV